LYVAATDEAGNISDINTTTYSYNGSLITIGLTDATNISGKSIATKSSGGASTIYEKVSIKATNATNYKYKFDDGTLSSERLISNVDINISDLSETAHTLLLNAYTTTQESNKTISFTVDNTPPAAALINGSAIANTTFNDLELDIAITSTDGATIKFDANNSGTYDTYASAFTINGDRNISVRTYDEAGNYKEANATFTQNLTAVVKEFTKGWQIVALPTGDVNTSLTDGTPVWDYNGTKWGNNLGNGYENLTDANISKGYWVNFPANKSINYSPADQSVLNISTAPNGWSLVGTHKDISAANLSDANASWQYSSGKWLFKTNLSGNDDVLSGLGYGKISTIPAYSGFWIYKE
jgi:hypothetical protein